MALKVALAAVPVVVSALALAVSLRSYRYTRDKDARARQQSIQDDYWIRKVVSPLSIEPFLKFANELAAALPGETATAEQVKLFWSENVDAINQLSTAFGALELINAKLNEEVQAKIWEFEDVLANYCGALQQAIAGEISPFPDPGAAKLAITTTSLAVLRPIQAHQTDVGSPALPWWERTWGFLRARRPGTRKSP